MLKRLSMEGRIDPADAQGVSRFAFIALPVEPGIRGAIVTRDGGVISLNGELTREGVSARLDGLRLQDWPGDYVPRDRVRFMSVSRFAGSWRPRH